MNRVDKSRIAHHDPRISSPPTSEPASPDALPYRLQERLATGRHDYHRSDANREGVPACQLSRWERAGFLQDLGDGDYVIRTRLTGGDRFAQARCEHLRRCQSFVNGSPGLYLVGPSSVMAHDLPLWHLPEQVEVSKRPRHRSMRRGIRARMPWGSGPVMVAGMQCQVIEEAVVELAAHSGVVAGLVTADALLHQGGDRDALAQAAEAYGNRAGARQARFVAELADARIESPGESITRWIAHQHGIELTPQVELRDEQGRFVARVDFVIAGTNVVVEFDGLGKYQSAADLRREKLRQMAIERLGWRVIRFTFQDLHDEQRLVWLLRRAVVAAA